MNTPEVAIITRTKDRPLLLERAIKSIVKQSFQDFQLVIVNDGGSQKPVNDLVKKYSPQLKNHIQVIHSPKKLGAGGAMNEGIKMSNSKYIAALDDDDTWEPTFLAVTTKHLQTQKCQGVVTAADVIFEKVSGRSIRITKRRQLSPEINTISYFRLLSTGQFPNNAFVYDRQALVKIGGYSEEMAGLEDWDFAMRFMRYFDIDFIPVSLSNYHRRPEQSGKLGNSIYLMADRDRQIKTKLLNKYLREDLDENRVGVGVLANISERFFSNNKLINELVDKMGNLGEELPKLSNRIEEIHSRTKKLEELAPPLDVRLRRKFKNPGSK